MSMDANTGRMPWLSKEMPAVKIVPEGTYLPQTPIDHGVRDDEVEGIAEPDSIGDGFSSHITNNWTKRALAEVEQDI